MNTKVLHEIKHLFSSGQKDFKHGDFNSALVQFNAAFGKFRDHGDSEGMAETLYEIGITQQKLGQFNDAIVSLKEALELYRFLKKQEREVITLHAIGIIQAEIGADEIATKYLEDALAIYKIKDYKSGIAAIQFELGNIYFKGGEHAEARRQYEEAAAIIKQIDGIMGMAKVKYMLALLDFVEGNLDACMEKLDEANALFQNDSDIEGQVRVHSIEGLIALRKGNTKEAENCFDECARLVAEGYLREPSKTGVLDKQMEVQLLLYMGTLLFNDTKYNLPDLGMTLHLRAYKYFEDAVVLAEKIKYRSGVCQGLFNMGMILFDRGDLDSIKSSVDKFSSVLDIAKEIKNNELIVKSLLFLGIAHRCLNKHDQALVYLQDCSIISKRLKYAMLEARALMEKTRIMLVFGKLDDGFSTLAQARAIVAGNADLAVLDWEILVLQSDLYQGTGALDKATESLLRARDECINRNDKKGLVKVLHEMVKLDERQGFISHAIACLTEIESIHKASNQFTEMSRARIDKARLVFISGDVDRAMGMLRDEITFIRDTGITDGDALIASARVILFKILKFKNEIIESEEIFRDLLSYFSENNKMSQLFDIFIEIAYDAIDDGNIISLKRSMEKLWKIISQSRETIEQSEQLVYFLHVYGLMHQCEGTAASLDLARKYFGECLTIIQKANMDDMKPVITAQLADLAVVEGKGEALSLFNEALRHFTEAGKLLDAVRVHEQIAWILYTSGNLDEALDHALNAARMFEDHLIAHSPYDITNDIKRKFHYYTRRFDVYAFLASLYLEKFIQEKDDIALERALISVEFQKIYTFHQQYYAKHMFTMLSCPKLEKYIEQDEQLSREAVVKQKSINFLADCKAFHERILMTPDAHKEFTKRTIDFLKEKLKDERAALASIVSKVKLNRAYLMECKDPGSLLPFIGFNVVKQAQKQLAKYPDFAVLDYAILPGIAKIATFLMYKDRIEVFLKELTPDFFAIIDRLREARSMVHAAEILVLHRQLTAWLFPPRLKECMAKQGVKYIFISPDARLGDVFFTLLGDDNDLAKTFTFVYISHLIDFKIVMREGTGAKGSGGLNFYILFPDATDEITIDEKANFEHFFAGRSSKAPHASPAHVIMVDNDAGYQGLKDIARINPNVIHYTGTCFFPASLPFKGHLNMNDRSYFLEDFMDLDLANKQGLLCISSTDESPLDINQALVSWKTLALCNIPHLFFVQSRFGSSGRIFTFFYDCLLKGDTIGQAYHNTMLYFAKMQEISPLALSSHVLIANPFWKLAGVEAAEKEEEI
ncbi:MAG: tetratricopeptide repeat protein [Candidatus Sigynarchaeota archaeon]